MEATLKVAEISPKAYARMGGLFYLIIIVAGIFSEMFVRARLVVSNDAAATAQNIINSETLWRIGIAGDLVMHICDVFLTLILYVLLKPVNKKLALLAVFFNLVQTAVLVANKLNLLNALFLLSGAEYLNTFEAAQLQALAYLSIKTHANGYGFGLIFFGFECLIIGYLIFKSGYLPRIIGIMMSIAGVCYLINSFSLIVAPSFANTLFPAIMFPPFLGELALCVWMIFKGVDTLKWNEKLLASAKTSDAVITSTTI